MTQKRALRRLAPTVAAFAALGLAAPIAQAAESPDVQKALDAVKAAYDKYKDPSVAVADGFAATDQCSEGPDGVMGYHYVNSALVGAPVDQMKPPVVIYQPDGNGGRKLVAIEYFKPDADQNLATSDDKPSLYGRAFDGPMEGHAPGMPKHYDMHVWLWQTNPKGTFAQFNPAGSCKTATATMSHGDSTGTDSSSGTTSGGTSSGGQVSSVPSGAAQTGGERPVGGDRDMMWLYGVGGAAMAAGAFVLTSGRRTARRKI